MIHIRKFIGDENGATAVEYALIAAIISISIVGSMKMISQAVQGNLNGVSNSFNALDH